MKRKLNIAVRELVDFVCRTGDLTFSFSSARRAVEAIRAHRKIQMSRPPTYRSEVPIALQYETEAFVLSISGRMDGVLAEAVAPGTIRTVIDEIKTTDRNLDEIAAEPNPVHWGQVKCYAHMFVVEHRLEEIDAQLTYFHFDSGKTLELRQTFTRDELDGFFQQLIGEYLKWAAVIVGWHQTRDASIQPLPFPFETYRPGQRPMAVDVYRNIREGGQLIVQAATGIGKTMAVVYPAVKAMGEGLTSKIFYLTARTTTRTVAEKALTVLRQRGLRIKALTLTAKDKICFNAEGECSADACEFACGFYDRLRQALTAIFSQDALDRSTIETAARTHRLCPFEFSLILALYADFIICDYNYAFDPRVYLRRFFLETNADYAFLIDESHNLVDRAREMFSAEISKQPFLRLQRQVRPKQPRLHKSLGAVNRHMARMLKTWDDDRPKRAEAEPPEALIPHLRHFAVTAEKWLARNEPEAFREDLLELYFAAVAFIRVYETYNASYVTCHEKSGRDLKLKLFCIDPSGQLEEALNRCRAAVFFSATMTPAAYFRSLFGCRPEAVFRHFPSPFASQNLGLFIFEGVSTYFKERRRTAPDVVRVIETLICSKKGNYLLYFPSYEYMRLVYDGFRHSSPQVDTVLQTPEMPESERAAFLERFSRENPSTLVGFAVMGGIFGEGIDLVGDRLSGAVVVGVGLPGITHERELIRAYFAATMDAGFEFAYMYPGIIRVLQAAGRVIRSEADRGVVLLLDRRFGSARYRCLLPDEWRPVSLLSEHQLNTHLRRFWETAAEGQRNAS